MNVNWPDLGWVLSAGAIKWRWELSHHLEQGTHSLTHTHTPSPHSFDSSIYVTPSPISRRERGSGLKHSALKNKHEQFNSFAEKSERQCWVSLWFLYRNTAKGSLNQSDRRSLGTDQEGSGFLCLESERCRSHLTEVTSTQPIIYQPCSKQAEMFWNWASSAIFFR